MTLDMDLTEVVINIIRGNLVHFWQTNVNVLPQLGKTTALFQAFLQEKLCRPRQ